MLHIHIDILIEIFLWQFNLPTTHFPALCYYVKYKRAYARSAHLAACKASLCKAQGVERYSAKARTLCFTRDLIDIFRKMCYNFSRKRHLRAPLRHFCRNYIITAFLPFVKEVFCFEQKKFLDCNRVLSKISTDRRRILTFYRKIQLG